MDKMHAYSLTVKWTGNNGTGTSNYRSYERSHTISGNNKPEIRASSDAAFRGDKTKYNPEELLLASIAGCHMLWFLHVCADSGIVVLDYVDNPTGIMLETTNGSGRFTEVTLHPVVTVKEPSALPELNGLHQEAGALCFIANSLNFPIAYNPAGKTI